MKTAKRIIVALLMVCLAVTGLPAVAQAADGDRAGTTLASRDVLEYYEAENMNYIDTMPALLQLQYKNEIELEDNRIFYKDKVRHRLIYLETRQRPYLRFKAGATLIHQP